MSFRTAPPRRLARAAASCAAALQMDHVGGLDRSIYCATKHALEGLSKALALALGQLGPHGIRINTVGRVEDVMGAVLFLASDAAALVTGSASMVDGGWTAA